MFRRASPANDVWHRKQLQRIQSIFEEYLSHLTELNAPLSAFCFKLYSHVTLHAIFIFNTWKKFNRSWFGTRYATSYTLRTSPKRETSASGKAGAIGPTGFIIPFTESFYLGSFNYFSRILAPEWLRQSTREMRPNSLAASLRKTMTGLYRYQYQLQLPLYMYNTN